MDIQELSINQLKKELKWARDDKKRTIEQHKKEHEQRAREILEGEWDSTNFTWIDENNFGEYYVDYSQQVEDELNSRYDKR